MNKCKIRRVYLKASITVETTLVMPCVIICIILLIVMNGYLHDQVVLNGMSVEILYSEQDNDEMLLQTETQKRILWLRNVTFSKNENSITKTIKWKTKYILPVGNLLSTLIDKTELELSGETKKQSWDMPKIIRYVNQN